MYIKDISITVRMHFRGSFPCIILSREKSRKLNNSFPYQWVEYILLRNAISIKILF